MDQQPQIQKSKKKLSKGFIIVLIIIVSMTTLAWAGLTKAGFIPNYFDIKILCPVYSDVYTKKSNTSQYEPWEKPVIYLYPKQEQKTEVKLNYFGNLIVSYPKYSNGWNVIAYPNGKIININDNKEYSYLFWEGEYKNASYDLSSGFIVKGSEIVNFLQDKLSQFGLTPKEYNEFIVYWMPRMQKNEYNLIHFATKEEYDDKAILNIKPKPDSLLRVFMVFKKVDREIKIKQQEIKPFDRNGFTVIEWGGTEIK